MEYLKNENIWINKSLYEEAERKYYENLVKTAVTTATPLADEVAKARQYLIENREYIKTLSKEAPKVSQQSEEISSLDVGAIKFFEKKLLQFQKEFDNVIEKISKLEVRVSELEDNQKSAASHQPVHAIDIAPTQEAEDDDELDLFDVNSSEDEADPEAAKVREKLLQAYEEKQSKKAPLIAKSSLILDVKPWDDETNMAELEKNVRNIKTAGLLWGASKLVPLAYGIHKLQIACVVEDVKVSIDWLQKQMENIEDYVQSVDIAAFNKI